MGDKQKRGGGGGGEGLGVVKIVNTGAPLAEGIGILQTTIEEGVAGGSGKTRDGVHKTCFYFIFTTGTGRKTPEKKDWGKKKIKKGVEERLAGP